MVGGRSGRKSINITLRKIYSNGGRHWRTRVGNISLFEIIIIFDHHNKPVQTWRQCGSKAITMSLCPEVRIISRLDFFPIS